MSEDGFEVLLVNAARLKHVEAARPTRSTPRGSPSCAPAGCCGPASCPHQRSASCGISTRCRKALIQGRARQVNRVHKLWEDAGAELACVASDVMGARGGR